MGERSTKKCSEIENNLIENEIVVSLQLRMWMLGGELSVLV